MELIKQVLASFQNIPPAAIIIFLIVSVVIAVEIWRLRPQRERPPVPVPPDLPPEALSGESPPPPPEVSQEFRPLSGTQIVILIILLMVVVAIPAGVLLYQRSRTLISQATPTPITIPSPTPVKTPFPTPVPTPPSQPVQPIPDVSPTPSPLPTQTPVLTLSPTPKSSPTASPSGLPQVKKPDALPGAGTSIFILFSLAGGGCLVWGLKKLNPKHEG